MTSQADQLDIWNDLISGEPTAPRRLITWATSRLHSALRKRFVALPTETLEDAIHDALLALIQFPAKYTPSQSSLLTYLYRIAFYKLVDECHKIAQRNIFVFVGGSVELEQAEANNISRTPSQDGYRSFEEEGDTMPEVESLLREILPTPQDRLLWELICEGRLTTEEYAAALGIVHLSQEDQKREVKRQRERVLKRVRRRQAEVYRLLYPEA